MEKDSLTSEITELKKKLEENPDSLVFAPLADAYRKQGSLEEAFNICKKGLAKHPTYTSARVVLGRIYQEKGNSEEATVEFKKVLEIDPENLMAHSLLGAIYIQKGDYQSAIEEYQKALTLNPDDEETQRSLKQAIERAAGEQKSPAPSKREASVPEKKTTAKESTATLTIAELYLKQGHLDKAVEVYQELLANDPQNLMVRQKLAEVVERQRKETPPSASVPGSKKSEVPAAMDPKHAKNKKEDDSKFTSEDILQVMRRGGKDDVMVEEKTPPAQGKKSEVPPARTEEVEKRPETELRPDQVDGLKGILAELSSVEGIMRCFLTGNNGITIVSMGETSNNADLGKQAIAIFQSTHRSVDRLNQGKLQQVLVTAETGHILLVSFADFVLIVLANSKINLGLLRLSLDSAIKKLDKIL